MTIPAAQQHVASIEKGEQPMAVMLDFMNPVPASGGPLALVGSCWAISARRSINIALGSAEKGESLRIVRELKRQKLLHEVRYFPASRLENGGTGNVVPLKKVR